MGVNNYNKKSIDELLCSGVLYVPEYQRNYSWEENEEIAEFWTDLENCITENYEDYFFGQIVIHLDGVTDKKYIIDGQQRTCTAVIILAVFRDLFDLFSCKDEEAKNIVEDIRIRNIGRWSTSRDTLRLHLGKNDDLFFRENIQIKPPKHLEEYSNLTKAQENILKAYFYLYNKLEEKIKYTDDIKGKIAKLSTYYKKFIESFKVICVETNDMNEAFVIFETLNARGKDLATSDLLKNYLFRMADRKIEEVKEKWTKMIEILDKLDATDYIRQFWNSQHSYVREKELYKKIRDNIKNTDNAINLTNDLLKISKLYKSLKLPNEEQYYECKYINDIIANLKAMGTASFYPVVISMEIKEISENSQKKVFKQIESLFFRNLKVANESQSQYDRFFSDVAIKVLSAPKDMRDICTIIREKTINDEEFDEKFLTLTIKSPTVAKFILREIGNLKQHELIIQDDRKIHLEHIMPKQKGKWNISKEEHQSNLNKLGNMTLLLDEFNKSVSNKSFNEKKEMYKKSDIVITKDLIKFKEWNIGTIIKRQKELGQVAKKRWGLYSIEA